MEARTAQAREGAITLTVPAQTPRAGTGAPKGPGTVSEGLFFNPAMRFSRDLSVLVVEEAVARRAAAADDGERPFRVFDGLAATGARALRLAAECRVPPAVRFEVHANDRDARAVETLAENVRANDLADLVQVTSEDFVRAVARRRWHYVDVDPYGSPAPFLDAAVRSLADRGVIAVTATDTAALTGAVPAPCRRRYDAAPWHGAGMHDAAIRILAGAAVRSAARHELALTPILAHATDHYVRVYLEARRGARRADAALARLAWLVEDSEGTRRFVPVSGPPPHDAARVAGPLWGGALQDADWVEGVAARVAAHETLDAAPLSRFLEFAAQETRPLPVYEAAELARALGGTMPRRDVLLDALRSAGFAASRSHTSPTAFRTDGPWPRVVALAARGAG